MPAQAALVLNDGTADVTFSPNGVRPDGSGQPVATWVDRSGGIQVGFATVTQTVRSSSAKTDVDQRILVPILETVAGDVGGYTPAPKVAYQLMSRTQYVLPSRSTTAQRHKLRFLGGYANGHAVTIAAVDNLEPTW